jgi:hypothetical protein
MDGIPGEGKDYRGFVAVDVRVEGAMVCCIS